MTERDRGVTLIEVVVALSLLGFALVGVLGGVGSTVRLSVAAADQTLADTSLQNALSALDALPYVSRATTYDLGTEATVTGIHYWTGTTWSPTCTGAQPQRITVAVEGRTLDVVKTNE